MVVFGAGASYDSVSATPLPSGGELQEFGVDREVTSRLPLANQLFKPIPIFSRVLDRFPQAAPLFPVLENSARTMGVEARLEEYQTEAKTHPHRVVQLASLRFYLREIIEQAQSRWLKHQRSRLNHITLIDEIECGRNGDDVLLVTFNYDTLIEIALEVVGMKIRTMADYVTAYPYKLIKLHGSVDWGRAVDFPIRQWDPATQSMPAADIISAASKWTFSQDYVRMDNYSDTGSMGDVYVPAIAVPVVEKSDFECPPSHLNTLKAMLPEVDRILTVGWAGNEKHFLRLLKSGLRIPPAISAVCGSETLSAETVEKLLSSGFPFGQTHAFPQGFSQFIEERAGKSLFNWT